MLIFHRMIDMTHEKNSWKMTPIKRFAYFILFCCVPPTLSVSWSMNATAYKIWNQSHPKKILISRIVLLHLPFC